MLNTYLVANHATTVTTTPQTSVTQSSVPDTFYDSLRDVARTWNTFTEGISP